MLILNYVKFLLYLLSFPKFYIYIKSYQKYINLAVSLQSLQTKGGTWDPKSPFVDHAAINNIVLADDVSFHLFIYIYIYGERDR